MTFPASFSELFPDTSSQLLAAHCHRVLQLFRPFRADGNDLEAGFKERRLNLLQHRSGV